MASSSLVNMLIAYQIMPCWLLSSVLQALLSQAATPIYGQAGWLLKRASEIVFINTFYSALATSISTVYFMLDPMHHIQQQT